ncbi:CLUMA_CG020944, isoform A [Clunio marinus]|uniref:CLUMA_CG020944, isoform A n=1 Tax=Clunio marinus TaxID=568069 RepID=A0A1J1J8U1_9DIPT|nr:CLUMA_CG020944, isoform A [Clunio marinus]
MNILMASLLLYTVILLTVKVNADIVEKNGICLDEIKALENCLNQAGQGQEAMKVIDACSALMMKMNKCINGKQ